MTRSLTKTQRDGGSAPPLLLLAPPRASLPAGEGAAISALPSRVTSAASCRPGRVARASEGGGAWRARAAAWRRTGDGHRFEVCFCRRRCLCHRRLTCARAAGTEHAVAGCPDGACWWAAVVLGPCARPAALRCGSALRRCCAATPHSVHRARDRRLQTDRALQGSGRRRARRSVPAPARCGS